MSLIRKFGKDSFTETAFKGTSYKSLLELEFELVQFWRDCGQDCLIKEIRDKATSMVKDWKQRGTLSATQLDQLKRWALDKSLFRIG